MIKPIEKKIDRDQLNGLLEAENNKLLELNDLFLRERNSDNGKKFLDQFLKIIGLYENFGQNTKGLFVRFANTDLSDIFDHGSDEDLLSVHIRLQKMLSEISVAYDTKMIDSVKETINLVQGKYRLELNQPADLSKALVWLDLKKIGWALNAIEQNENLKQRHAEKIGKDVAEKNRIYRQTKEEMSSFAQDVLKQMKEGCGIFKKLSEKEGHPDIADRCYLDLKKRILNLELAKVKEEPLKKIALYDENLAQMLEHYSLEQTRSGLIPLMPLSYKSTI
ncbi:MAG: hypothetical protein IJI46_06225 [Erysipelotrichaceae bacterium]|nr:hypothetical protein [Erysipelotrichaceae bacterium]